MLQWGRNFFVTEILYVMLFSLSPQLGFNGAVTFSLRKSAIKAKIAADAKALQWGRNFFVTEMSTADIEMNMITQLQWGRNFFVTEIGNRNS